MAQRNIRPLLMAVIDIHHPHALGKAGCRDAVDAIAYQLAARFGLREMTWNGDTLGFDGRGMAGSLSVAETDAHVRIRLGPLPGLMRPMVEAEIRRKLREHLG